MRSARQPWYWNEVIKGEWTLLVEHDNSGTTDGTIDTDVEFVLLAVAEGVALCSGMTMAESSEGYVDFEVGCRGILTGKLTVNGGGGPDPWSADMEAILLLNGFPFEFLDESRSDDTGEGGPTVKFITPRVVYPADILRLEGASYSAYTQLPYGHPDMQNNPVILGSSGAIASIEINVQQACLADINGDGDADNQDFSQWIAAYNAGDPVADQNCDGEVLPNDYASFLQNLISQTGC